MLRADARSRRPGTYHVRLEYVVADVYIIRRSVKKAEQDELSERSPFGIMPCTDSPDSSRSVRLTY